MGGLTKVTTIWHYTNAFIINIIIITHMRAHTHTTV